MVENFDGQTNYQGAFSPKSDGTTYNEVPVYVNSDGEQLWYSGSYNGWLIGSDHTAGSFGIQSIVCYMIC